MVHFPFTGFPSLTFAGSLPPGSAAMNSLPTFLGMPILLLPSAAAYMAPLWALLTLGIIGSYVLMIQLQMNDGWTILAALPLPVLELVVETVMPVVWLLVDC